MPGALDVAARASRGLAARRPPEHDPGREVRVELLEPVRDAGLDEDHVARSERAVARRLSRNVPLPAITM